MPSEALGEWESKLPPKKVEPPKIPKQMSFRPPPKVAEWIVKQSIRLGRSYNEVLTAIVEAEMYRPSDR